MATEKNKTITGTHTVAASGKDIVSTFLDIEKSDRDNYCLIQLSSDSQDKDTTVATTTDNEDVDSSVAEKLATLAKTIEAAEATNQTYKEQLASLEATNKSLKADCEALESGNQTLQTTNDTLTAQLAERDATVLETQDKLAKADDLVARYKEIIDSNGFNEGGFNNKSQNNTQNNAQSNSNASLELEGLSETELKQIISNSKKNGTFIQVMEKIDALQKRVSNIK